MMMTILTLLRHRSDLWLFPLGLQEDSYRVGIRASAKGSSEGWVYNKEKIVHRMYSPLVSWFLNSMSARWLG